MIVLFRRRRTRLRRSRRRRLRCLRRRCYRRRRRRRHRRQALFGRRRAALCNTRVYIYYEYIYIYTRLDRRNVCALYMIFEATRRTWSMEKIRSGTELFAPYVT